MQRGWTSDDCDGQSKETHRADLPSAMQNMQRQRTGISERQLRRHYFALGGSLKALSIAFMA
jgi:hypothetical protein